MRVVGHLACLLARGWLRDPLEDVWQRDAVRGAGGVALLGEFAFTGMTGPLDPY